VEEIQKKNNPFKSAGLPEWEKAAREELMGADPWEKLAHRGSDWTILPYYDKNNAVSPSPLLSAAENSSRGARTWYNCPGIVVDDPLNSNAKALNYLQQGADGILFELREAVNFEILLENIQWPFCSLNFLAKKNQQAIADALHRYMLNKNLDTQSLHGAFFTEQTIVTGKNQLPATGIRIIKSSSPAQEIAQGMLTIQKASVGDSARLNRMAISVSIGTDFFVEIAKLRALRVVWARFLDSAELGFYPLFIHAHSTRWADASYHPHENMLKSTTAAMASILGGCDALTLDPEDIENPLMDRIAMNVSHILREEYYFSKVADPLAGSYFVEALTSQVSQAAWQFFQSNQGL
jgi:methylmalonyl-CoA mutase